MKKTSGHSMISAWLFMTIFINLALVATIFAPAGHYRLSNVTDSVPSFYEDVDEVKQETEALQNRLDAVQHQMMELQWRLVHQEIQGKYMVETYQEYEIYKNNKGEVVKAKPTAHFDYLRYWRY